MKNLSIFFGILIILASSRFIPHPPNFTSLIALSFYVPVFFGVRFIPLLLACFVITDLFIGFHSVTFFTWGSVVIIGLVSKYFSKNIKTRIFGTLTGSLIFFLITNFGVWTLGSYGYSLSGFFNCYIMALPFFHFTLLSTVIYSLIIEATCKYLPLRVFNLNK